MVCEMTSAHHFLLCLWGIILSSATATDVALPLRKPGLGCFGLSVACVFLRRHSVCIGPGAQRENTTAQVLQCCVTDMRGNLCLL